MFLNIFRHSCILFPQHHLFPLEIEVEKGKQQSHYLVEDMSEFSASAAEAAITEGLKKMELSPALQEDHNFIMANLPEAAIVSLTPQFLTMILMRTAYSRVQLRIQIPENYPDEVQH